MNLPRPRFTVRWLMIAVAIVALIAAIPLELHRRQQRFMYLSGMHYLSGFAPENLVNARKKKWHTYMWAKYRYAAHHPWLWVPSDLPEPE
jgi:hypothetical protein